MGRFFALFSFLILATAGISASAAELHSDIHRDIHGEVYSESTYVPQYGVLTDTQIRLIPFKTEKLTTFVGVATQLQNKTRSSQESLYEKNLVMATAGLRYSLIPMVSLLAELRTEDRTRLGVIAGNMWQYDVWTQKMFTEFYAESLILPDFHNDPISTVWVKQGLRFELAEQFYLDPFLEAYGRRSPTPDLGRDTDQFRVGVRGLKMINTWSVGLLVYYAFPKEESNHEEALFVVGGSF